MAGEEGAKAPRPPANSRQNMAAGSTAGVVCRLVTSPFDVLKIRFQLQLEPIRRGGGSGGGGGTTTAKYSSVRQAMATIIKEEVRGFAQWL